MQYFPRRCSVICRKIEKSDPFMTVENGVEFVEEGIDVYEILDFSLLGFDKPFPFARGDKVICSAVGKRVNGTKDIFSMNPEYVAAKILV